MGNRPIAVSLKGRGLAVFDRPPGQGGLKRLGHHIAAETVDLGVAIATNIVLLTWSTWFSVILAIISLCFYAFFQRGVVARDGSMLIPVAFLIYLPTVMLAYMTNSRRLQAAQHLQTVQSHVVGMYMLHAGMASCGAPNLLTELDDAISDAMVQLQGYLAHARPLSSRHLSPSSLRAENLPVNSRLFLLGRDIGQRLRRLQTCMRRLAAAASALLDHCSSSGSRGGGHCTQQAIALMQQVVQLSAAVSALCTVKELRSPLLLRVMLRAGCILLSPLMSGSWLAWLAGQPPQAAGMVFAVVVAAITQVLLMTLFTLALLLEDPFDIGSAAAPDTISLLEFNHTLSYLTAPPNPEEEPPESCEGTESQQQPEEQAKSHQQIQGFVMHQQQLQQHVGEHGAAVTTANAIAAAPAAPAAGPAAFETGLAALHEVNQVSHNSNSSHAAVRNSAAVVSIPCAASTDAGVTEVGVSAAASSSYPGGTMSRAPPALMTRSLAQQPQALAGMQEVQVAIDD